MSSVPVTVCTLAVGGMAPVWDLARRTWEPYCAAHGYRLAAHDRLHDASLAPSWNKLLVVAEELSRTGGPVWWVDADVTVADPSEPLESPEFDRHDLTVSADWNGHCFALFRARPTAWTRRMLSLLLLLGDVRDPDPVHGLKWEQDALKLLIREFPAFAAHVGTLPRHWVHDQPGHRFNHFGGRTNDERVALIRRTHPALGGRC